MQPLNFMPVEVNFRPSGKYWLATCSSLDIATQGETFERAQENLMEAILLFIESCLHRGTLEEVLRHAGFSKTRINDIAKAATEYLPLHVEKEKMAGECPA
jgi:predicted RNase H-like HicB family nuclease